MYTIRRARGSYASYHELALILEDLALDLLRQSDTQPDRPASPPNLAYTHSQRSIQHISFPSNAHIGSISILPSPSQHVAQAQALKRSSPFDSFCSIHHPSLPTILPSTPLPFHRSTQTSPRHILPSTQHIQSHTNMNHSPTIRKPRNSIPPPSSTHKV
ncbi:hypothetical protein ONZ45_g17347 [Pleurotus djamor]|nr:hypothetical protein ONZ45_g17347 [Pleurotus djamor]